MRGAVFPVRVVVLCTVLLPLACGAAPDAERAVREATVAAEPRPVGAGADLAARLGCGACHAGAPLMPAAAPLPVRDPSLDPAAIFAYLRNPPAPAEGAARMPDYGLSESEAAALALTIAGGAIGRGDAAATLRAVVRARPLVADSALGARIRRALRCDACHDGRPDPGAPPLQHAASHVKPEWLRAFLAAPHAVRPLGWRPGSSTRMPDFHLTQLEIDSLVAWLSPGEAAPATAVARPSERVRANTLQLMRERWGCMGCHAWNGAGGRIAPDLALAAERLRPDHVRAMLLDPEAAVPGTIMPRPLLEPRDVDRIVAVLVHNEESGDVWRTPLSLLEPGAYEPATGDDAASVYDRACAVCHGRSGQSDGVNAHYLDVRPARHAHAADMAARPDDTLYDGIAAGGRILGRSAEMPAFGGSLEPALIEALVAHIRTLCDCEEPEWSSDGAPR